MVLKKRRVPQAAKFRDGKIPPTLGKETKKPEDLKKKPKNEKGKKPKIPHLMRNTLYEWEGGLGGKWGSFPVR